MSTRHLKILTIIGFVMCLLSFSPTEARADAVLTLSPVSGLPGTTVTVDGIITNTGTTTVYLNSEDFTLNSSSFLNGDITDFLLNAPVSLLAGGAPPGLIALFTFDIAPGTSAGPYAGNFLDIIGGTDPSDFTDTLATAEFTVNVQSTPEPGTFLLLTLGIFFLGGLYLMRRGKIGQIV